MAFVWSRPAAPRAGSISLVCAIVAAQVAIAGVVVCLMALLSAEQAVAALLGAAVCVLPTALFARAAGSRRGARRLLAYGVARSAATIALMALCVAGFNPPPLGFLAALGAVHLAYAIVPLMGAAPRRGRLDAAAEHRAWEAG